ncbi:oxidoreductase [Oleiphilus messinensis]|uniref:Oxidoreductase n=1 Tax=Oleiphilus messinensis TaxID=141451 RepID=A0A1Y0I980_9GAMM|nr:YhdH/YhfP family quinone oxidoreductase [Oleiphilus messinensis]ARU57068.1 oxidoreductase [Oleiphilus messinensis]
MADFRALKITNDNDGVRRSVETLPIESLPDHDVLIRVKYSSLNYKDCLSATGNKGVTRTFPHVPGIDAAGEVVESRDGAWKAGDQVIVTGYDLGMNTWGGFGEYIRVPANWIVACPEGLSLLDAMTLGTAGLTAGLSVQKLLASGVKPEDGAIAVSGATGGVGCIAVALLAKLGFDVSAISGKPDAEAMLTELGAKAILDRSALEPSPKPMLKELWGGAIDTVGGEALNTLIKSTKAGGSVTACGMVAGLGFEASVFPFILRGVNLLGVDSVEIPLKAKAEIWQLFANEWSLSLPESAIQIKSLDELSDVIDAMLSGHNTGRVVVKHADA